ncbi:galactoside 2-alpha-L-fucosyltransferase SEC1-like [Haliotis rubra]|uniref:galactoside 2-alpha-L-fucosyltransferase SEC1-like n=1 Tax=Haliotis rubra TaxID=36100 RepID=UPI001EE4F7F0|nr:galactoside 2-alpha-L-fucosyltransferase SEC1-like [Haliotis rubra]
MSSYDIHTNKTCPFNFSLSDTAISKALARWRTARPREKILTISLQGRLGNHMFQYASLLGIAFLSGRVPVLENSLTTQNLTKLFDISFVGNVSKANMASFHETKYASYDCELYNLPDSKIEVQGYRQSWKYFYSIRTEIRKEFTFVQKYRNLSAQCFQKYTGQYKNRSVIGLHVRRTDMTQYREMGYTSAPLSYIRKAIRHMKTKFRDPIFLIATDDKRWCRKNLQSPDVILMDNTDPYLDFATLTLCDHMIMTVGTFGWWAAWLSNGYTVYYKDYPRAGSWLASEFTDADYFMPDWVPLGA